MMPSFSIMLALLPTESNLDSFRFAHPWWLLLAVILPVFLIWKGRPGPQAAVVFSSLHILKRMGPLRKSRPGHLRFALFLLTFLCGVIALARPQVINTRITTSESGIELILTLDVSRSMLAEDFFIGNRKVTRLTAAKKVTRDFISGRTTDRIGVVAFAGRPFLVSPITLDHSWIEDSLDRVQIGLVEDGTAIGSALAAAARRLDTRPSKSKVIVLLTDGANNAGNIKPETAAKLAATLGIRIHTIAVGTYGDFVVPTPAGPQRLTQEFDEATLKKIAEIGNGEFFHAQDTNSLERIFRLIDEMEKTEVKRQTHVTARELFHWPAMLALLFGLISLIGEETFWRRVP